MTELSELLPCPFCGGAPILMETNELRPDKYQRYCTVRCDECGIEMGEEYEHEIIAAWNTRARPAVDGEVERLKAALRKQGIRLVKDAAADKDTYIVCEGAVDLRALAAAIAAAQVDGWQPIESAPKDGSNILIIAMKAYSPEARQGWWDGEWWAFYSRPEKFVVPGPTHMIEVTHWRPLPEPPAQPKQGQP